MVVTIKFNDYSMKHNLPHTFNPKKYFAKVRLKFCCVIFFLFYRVFSISI